MAVFTLGNLASVVAPSYETLMIARFVAGVPHGAFFGVAALVATHLMGPQNRAKAVAHVMTGLTVATVIGVPMASWLGQALGWRSAFGLVVAIGAVTLTAMWFWLPTLRSMHVTSPLTELGALRRVQVWLALLVGMIGFGGMFAVYTYISTTMTDVAGLPRALVPVALMVFGVGMVVGNLYGGRMADKSVIRGLYVSMAALGTVLAVFVLVATTRGRRWWCCSGSARPARRAGAADPADGRRARRADAGGGAEPLGAQHRQCDRGICRRFGHRGRIRLHRARRRPRCTGRSRNCHPHRVVLQLRQRRSPPAPDPAAYPDQRLDSTAAWGSSSGGFSALACHTLQRWVKTTSGYTRSGGWSRLWSIPPRPHVRVTKVLPTAGWCSIRTCGRLSTGCGPAMTLS